MKNKMLCIALSLILWQNSYASENKKFLKNETFLKRFLARDDKGALTVGLFSGAITLGRTRNNNFNLWQSAGYSIASSVLTYIAYETIGKKIAPLIIRSDEEEGD